MKTIRQGFEDFEFKDNDPDFACFKQLIELEEKGILTKMDFDVISSMFELHRKLRSLSEILLKNGFTPRKNKRSPSATRTDAIWKYEKKGEETRTLKYEERTWETMWNRSDHYHIDIQYNVKDLTVTYQFKMCETDYGRRQEHEKHCSIKKNDKIILEHEKDYLKKEN